LPPRPPNIPRKLYGIDVLIPKGIRIRGRELAELLEHGADFGFSSVNLGRVRQQYIPASDKARLGIPFNIYDAARSYKETHDDERGLRAIIKDSEFRNAWNTFRGGYRWERKAETNWALERGRRKDGGIYSTTAEKMRAAEVLGWSKTETTEALRRQSP
jgi:hypothetical protein